MNFVIVSLHFFPQADAESFCSTRFASALAREGHNVQVITLNHPKTVSDAVYNALVDPRLKIIRVDATGRRVSETSCSAFPDPVSSPDRSSNRSSSNSRPVFARLRYLTYELESPAFSGLIRGTKAALRRVEKPILISRTHPLGSLIVAWHARKLADKWIAHLSDPLPWFFWNSFFGRLRYHFERLWIKRAFREADGISVTCRQVCRFFHENYGAVFDRQHTFVTTHIGDTALKGNRKPWTQRLPGKIIAHPGTLYAGRGAEAIADAVKTLNEEGISCTLAMVGGGSPDQVAALAKRPHILMLNDYSPELSLSLTEAADVLFVSDFESTMPYSPRLMSKFVYQVFEDKPMVVRAAQVSAQHDYCERFPNSGLFYADDASQASLVAALRSAINCPKDGFDRSSIRREFSGETIARGFVDEVRGLGA